MTMNPHIFSLIPAVALLCNLFLFMTLLTARKNQTIYSFMMMLGAFMMWTGGSLMLRLQMYPSPNFWWEVSVSGIILVPWLYYLMAGHYVGERGWVMKCVWGAATILMLIMNHNDMYMSRPVITVEAGRPNLSYITHPLAAVPILIAVLIFISVWRIMLRGLRKQGVPSVHFTPFLIGVLVMFIVIVLQSVAPVLNTLPLDTAACAINAICIYYAFCKKRIFALSQIASKGAAYFMTILVVCSVLVGANSAIRFLFDTILQDYVEYEMIIVAVLCTMLAILVFNVLNLLLSKVFVRDQIEREDRLRRFSTAVNRTLQLDQIIDTYVDLLHEAVHVEHAYVCLYHREDQCYWSEAGSAPIHRKMSLREDNPLILWLREHESSISYSEFRHSSYFKSMWETEKRALAELNIGLILPIRCDEQMVGITLLSEKNDRKPYSFDETMFLESAVSIVSIAMQNANLYETIQRDAQCDALTGLYNRRYFNNKMEVAFQQASGHSISVILFNLDNFRLYNELYGSGKGDEMLITFSRILESEIGSKGTIARYGGKEFAILLPFFDSTAAREIAERIGRRLQEDIRREEESTRHFLTFSAGICNYPTAAANPDQLLSYANLAVFSAKQHGKNRIMVYTRSADNEPQQMDKATIVEEYSSTIYALTAAIDAKDHYTFNHSNCVAQYAASLAEAYGLNGDHVEIIRQAGLLHDIGKIGIPDSILTKAGKLTDEEFAIMRQHVERSIEMIRHLPSLDYVIPAVLGHHERWDGKGYPRGIAGEAIPIGARCLCIVDSFDAMVSRRSYKHAMPVEDALNEIRRNLGRQFDPELGFLFISMVEEGKIKLLNY
ncbi:HD domain-containing phosphohydrolase [Butyricicoccus sp. Marseille-Q5471]|uniref:HD domain-containing phosphohydrolase n=1 Tax=Butyricicoccus sp. Marseille-Q5471 TaxID=3039493 RepID=UPI0024BC832A|nr:HD domain-containing phosphohydrolase [Butyricicoccus sp. Marseille-Q5471]